MMKIREKEGAISELNFTLMLSRVDPSKSLVVDYGGERSFGFPGDQRGEIYKQLDMMNIFESCIS